MSQRNTDKDFIEEMRDKLVAFGVPRSVFDPASYVFYTDTSFAKLLRPLKCINGNLNTEKVLQIGVTNGFFSTVNKMKPLQFYRFLESLRTPDGQTFLSQAAKLSHMEKRAGDTLTVAEVGLLDMFNAQKSDYNSKASMVRKRYELLIADLKQQLQDARTAMAQALEAIKIEFEPAGTYSGIPKEDLTRLCWNAYLAEHGQRKLPDEQDLQQAVNEFGQDVRRTHKFNYLETGNRKQLLMKFVENKVVRLVEAGYEQAAKRFDDLLDLVQLTTNQP